MTWVNWMRDRLDADFHVLITSETTGSGGREHVVVAIGQRAYAGRSDTLLFTSNPNDAADTIRRSLLRVIGQLLLPHAARGVLGPLFLARGTQTNEQVIARQHAQATNHRYFTFFGLRYQFGSIFNSGVNPRFGNISGSEF